jgi:hypothetical protein
MKNEKCGMENGKREKGKGRTEDARMKNEK